MKSLFKKLFKRTVEFEPTSYNYVCVLNSATKREPLRYGNIQSIDFDARKLTIGCKNDQWQKSEELEIGFDQIVTISRMKDGRLRLWIKVEGD